MIKYDVCIREILEKVIEIEADSLEEAEEKVEEMYHNEEIVLDSSDYMDTEIETLRDSEGNVYV